MEGSRRRLYGVGGTSSPRWGQSGSPRPPSGRPQWLLRRLCLPAARSKLRTMTETTQPEPGLRAITPAQFVDVMAELPAGVAVITTRGPAGPMGLTVTSLGPYTASPPSVMLSVAHSSRSCRPLLDADRFGVHLLGRDQEHVAAAFVSKSDDKFAGLDWEWDGDDIPRIANALAYLRCVRETSFTHRDHSVLIGAICGVRRRDPCEPLLYLRRRFAWDLAVTPGS